MSGTIGIVILLLLRNFSETTADYRKSISLKSGSLLRGLESRIIGGGDAAIEEYPFAVSLQNNGTFFGHDVEHFCGGSIIGKRWIVTSAQCVLRATIKKFYVRAGSKYYYKGGEIYSVKDIAVHPMFSDNNYDYDVGLVELEKGIPFDDTKRPIKLASRQTVIDDGTPLDIAGWGAKELLGPVVDQLRFAKTTKISNEQCAAMNGNGLVTDRMFCVFFSGVGPCVGDSGSPAVYKNVLIGVASWSRSCVYRYPTAYANLSSVASWIREVTGNGIDD